MSFKIEQVKNCSEQEQSHGIITDIFRELQIDTS